MKAVRFIERVLKIISSILFTALIIVVFLQVMLRYFWSHPLAWSDELARLLLIWAASFGVTLIFYSPAGHPAVTFVLDKLPVRTRSIIEICKNFGLAVLMLYVGYYGVQYTIACHRFQSAVLHYPNSVKYAVFPIIMVLMAYKSIVDGVIHVKEMKKLYDGGEKK